MTSNPTPVWLALLSAGILATGAAQAKQCAGVDMADQTQVDGKSLVLNGVGLRLATMLKVKVYVGGLYVAKASSDPAAILASTEPTEIVLQFVRDVGVDDLRKGWDEGFEKNVKGGMPALKDRIAQFNGWMGDVKTGQKLSFLYKPGTGVTVTVNGAVKGTIKGDDFGKALLSIWLGDPPNAEVKSGMLGGACG